MFRTMTSAVLLALGCSAAANTLYDGSEDAYLAFYTCIRSLVDEGGDRDRNQLVVEASTACEGERREFLASVPPANRKDAEAAIGRKLQQLAR